MTTKNIDVKLQGLGTFDGMLVKDLAVGMIEVRNLGYTYDIIDLAPSLNGKWIVITMQSRTGSDKGVTYTQKRKSDSKIAAYTPKALI